MWSSHFLWLQSTENAKTPNFPHVVPLNHKKIFRTKRTQVTHMQLCLWWWQITAVLCVCVFVIWENIISNMVIHCTEAHWERKEQLWSVCACAVCVSVIHIFYQWCQSWILFITLGRWSQSHLTYFYLEANALCSIVISHFLWQISRCRLWAWYEAHSSWRIVGKYFSLHHTKDLELNFTSNSTKNSSHPKKMLMSPRRIMVLITSVFRLIVFLRGLCLLIMSTNRSGNSNYFLDWGQNPCI